MIRNKRALVRMLEAIIAIMILLGFFIFVMSKQAEKPNIAEDIYKLERKILREAADNLDIREAVLSDPPKIEEVKFFIADRLSAHPALNFSIAICKPPGKGCIGPKLRADIYVDDIVISSLLGGELNATILRLFIWVGAARKVEVCNNDGNCGAVENCGNCPSDCPCAPGEDCIGGVCTPAAPACDGYPLGEIIFFGSNVGECEEGQKNCTETGWDTIEEEVGPTAESCNGLDDDCDEETDEDLTQWCNTGYTGEDPTCEEGVQTCTAGSWGSCEYKKTLEEEKFGLCTDGLDNNCNGLIDDCL